MTQTIWQDLLKTALLGTDRTLPTVETLSALSEFGISTDDPTEATLAGAGVFALAQKAGFMLKDFDKNLPDAALDETARPMSAASVRHLQRLLSPDFRLCHLMMSCFCLMSFAAWLRRTTVWLRLNYCLFC